MESPEIGVLVDWTIMSTKNRNATPHGTVTVTVLKGHVSGPLLGEGSDEIVPESSESIRKPKLRRSKRIASAKLQRARNAVDDIDELDVGLTEVDAGGFFSDISSRGVVEVSNKSEWDGVDVEADHSNIRACWVDEEDWCGDALNEVDADDGHDGRIALQEIAGAWGNTEVDESAALLPSRMRPPPNKDHSSRCSGFKPASSLQKRSPLSSGSQNGKRKKAKV